MIVRRRRGMTGGGGVLECSDWVFFFALGMRLEFA
jgi:hypothetical protein